MSARTAGRFALFSWVLSVLLAAAALAIMVLVWSVEVPANEIGPVFNSMLIATAFSTVGALVAARRPGNVIGWILCASGLLAAVSALADSYAAHALYSSSEHMPGAALAAWTNVLTATAGMQLFPLLLLLFPDGRLPSRRWRPVVWLIVGVVVAEVAFWAFAPGRFPGWPPATNPFGVAALKPLLDLYVRYAQTLLLMLTVLLPVAGLVARFRRSRGVERQQLKWFTSSGVLVVFAAAMLFLVGPRSSELMGSASWGFFVFALCTVPASMGVAILRYRLWDIDLVINRALVYGALTMCVVGIYVLVVGYLGAFFRVDGNVLISLAATGLVAVFFAPLRDRLQRAINRLMYGERDDPYAVLTRLGERLEATLAPDAVLIAIVETVKEALKLPHAAIALERRDGTAEIVASVGDPVGQPLRLPLVYQNEPVGELLLGPRGPREEFGPADRRLLDGLARQAGVAVHAVRLTNALQRSRERLVTAREEERRRLRRDLHDGLGPALGSLPLKLDVAGDLMERDPVAARVLLDGLKAQAKSAVAHIRRLVYELRPPALDDLGLLGAVREIAAQHGAKDLRVSVEAPEDDSLTPLPAAVEVAAYRIVQEAVTNVSRHAGASDCTIRLSLDGGKELRVEVSDDGRGIGEKGKAGVGFLSMRERAEELGGSCVVEPQPGGGTRVRATLPLSGGEE